MWLNTSYEHRRACDPHKNREASAELPNSGDNWCGMQDDPHE